MYNYKCSALCRLPSYSRGTAELKISFFADGLLLPYRGPSLVPLSPVLSLHTHTRVEGREDRGTLSNTDDYHKWSDEKEVSRT